MPRTLHLQTRPLALAIVSALALSHLTRSASAQVKSSSVASASKPTVIALLAPQQIILGKPTKIEIARAEPGEVIRLHALRSTTVFRNENGKRSQANVIVHAWTDFRADSHGRVVVDSAVPLAGTYTRADHNGLLWSGWPEGDPRLGEGGKTDLKNDQPSDDKTLVLALQRDGIVTETRRTQLVDYSDRIRFVELTVARDGVSGVFATPAGSTNLGAVILLHGSEGGSMSTAREWAGSLAEQGLPVLALNYVAYSFAPINGVSEAMANIPVEILDRARSWLSARAEVNPKKIGLLGVSKGAEFALVGASHFPWVRAVVACVPSDVVWAGYGRDPKPGELLSSWSIQGTPLPFISYDHYEDVFTGKATSVAVHIRSRAESTEAQQLAARIPVEKISGHILLFGSGNDQVWPSAGMVKSISQELSRAGGSQYEVHVNPTADHFICGTGTNPVRAGGADGSVDAMVANETFEETITFLHQWLK